MCAECEAVFNFKILVVFLLAEKCVRDAVIAKFGCDSRNLRFEHIRGSIPGSPSREQIWYLFLCFFVVVAFCIFYIAFEVLSCQSNKKFISRPNRALPISKYGM